MKYVRFTADDKVLYGSLKGEMIYVLDGSPFGTFNVTGKSYETGKVRILPPVLYSKALCIGLNYRDHAVEFGLPIPETPVVFMKPSTSAAAQNEDIIYPAMCHRLDYEADGVIGIISKNIPLNNISKSYYAVVCGDFKSNIILSNKIDAENKQKVKVLEDNGGFPAVIKKVSSNGKYSLISVALEKAARHQVRAFLSYLHFPILGDKLYGGANFKRLCLHCFSYTINNKTVMCKKQTDEFLKMYKSLD